MNKRLYTLVLFTMLFLHGCINAKPKEIQFNNKNIHYLGLIPGANCQTKYQLDLFANKTYLLRTTCRKNNVNSKNSDDIGKWHIDSQNRLVLRGGREAPKYFYILDNNSIQVMDLSGEKIESKLNYTLQASSSAKTLEPELYMTGMYNYMADAARFQECITGVKYPVAFEEDSLALERAYLKIKRVPNEPLKVHIKAKVALKTSMEGNKKVPTIVVKKFIKIIQKETCPHLGSEAKLTNTYWKLTILNDKALPHTQAKKREAFLIFSNGKVKGNSGCNGLGGTYALSGDKISFSDKGFMMTRMFCQGSVEIEFIKTLKKMYRYKIVGEYLEIFDIHDIKLARFESVYL